MHKTIPYGRQWIDEEDIEAVVRILKSDYLTTGPTIAEFESAFAKKVNAKFAVAVSNGTAALHAAAFALGLKEGDEVITTAMTFAATANSVLYMKATPVFVDIHPVSYNIDPSKIEAAITPKTKAIFVVHFTGQPCEMDEIRRIADSYNLKVVEDASHALGAIYKERPIGSISELTTFSLHPVKHITTGEGGVITTNDETLYQKLILFRSHGITRQAEMMHKNEGSWYYEQLELGYNYRLTDIQAALGLSQLKRLDQFVSKRKDIAQRYFEKLQGQPFLQVPEQIEGCCNSWHLYVLQIDFDKLNKTRKDLFEDFRALGIFLNVHYIPVYKHPYYQNHGFDTVQCLEAEKLYDKMVSIPMYPLLTEEEQDYVIDHIKKWIQDSIL